MLPICIKALYHLPFLNLHQGLFSKSMQKLCPSYHNIVIIGQSVLETLSINKENVNEIHEIEVFLGSNLNFTVRLFYLGFSK